MRKSRAHTAKLGRLRKRKIKHANGKVAHAEYENSKQAWVYDVGVVSGAKVFDVKVDANKGTVISSVEDKADHNDDRDKRD